jgi:hypothetical protein
LLLLLFLILAAALWLSGCTAKGYITTSVNTVLGLDVSENPKTQVPHVRFGFVRSQYYYIPTGLTPTEQGIVTKGAPATETPELVSEIDVDIKFLNWGRVRERFAVGQTAVLSNAAQILFNPEGKPVITVKSGDELTPLQTEIRKILQDPQKLAKAKEWIKNNFSSHPYRDNPDKFLDDPPEPAVPNLKRMLQYLKS